MIDVRFNGDWAEADRIAKTLVAKFQKAVDGAVMREAHYLRAMLIKGITSGAPGGVPFKPLSPMTLALRRASGLGGSKPLMATLALRSSITVVKVGQGAFVGVLRSSGGTGRGAVGMIQEFGANVQRTDKQRRYLAAKLRAAGIAMPSAKGGGVAGNDNGRTTFRIPPRPFIRPVLEKYGRPEDVRRRFYQSIAEAMGGDLGGVAKGGTAAGKSSGGDGRARDSKGRFLKS